MPRGDGTGRFGFGPFSGRGMGYCAGYPVPGYMNNFGMGRGRGFGRGFGMGMGMGAGYGMYAGRPFGYEGVDQAEVLSNQISALEQQLKAANERLEQLKKEQ